MSTSVGTVVVAMESIFRKEYVMRRQLHAASAAAAMTFVVCITVLLFVVLALPAMIHSDHALLTAPIRSNVRNFAKATCLILLLGYAAGIVGWLATLAMGCDGMHRLASVLNGPTSK
jgi:hypothetical protein